MKFLYTALFFIFSTLFFIPCNAQYKVLHNFNKTDGAYPYDDLIVSGSTLYGMTNGGGKYGHGTIFAIQTDGSLYNVLLDFNDTDGAAPYGHLAISGDTLFGMTYLGGNYGKGVIFSMLTNGTGYTILRNLGGAPNDPINPIGKLTLIGSTLYGMSSVGGINGLGNIFSISTIGSNYIDLYDFNNPGGIEPQANLVFSRTVMYGTAYMGGIGNAGILFSFDLTTKVFGTLFNFEGTRGENPQGSLLLSGSTLYGMTTFGGNSPDSAGNIFAICDTGWGFTDLVDFSRVNGAFPYGSLIFYEGKLLGMTTGGGADSAGIIFTADTTGTGFADLFDFKNTQGTFPHGSLLLSNNVLYGMAYTGGVFGYGVIFSFTDSTVGINEMKTNSKLVDIFPNPSNGVFTISFGPATMREGITNIEVFNVMGEKVFTSALPQIPNGILNSIDLSNQPDGVYFYRVIGEYGALVKEGKFIIQK